MADEKGEKGLEFRSWFLVERVLGLGDVCICSNNNTMLSTWSGGVKSLLMCRVLAEFDGGKEWVAG
jgi:hypothetical protein